MTGRASEETRPTGTLPDDVTGSGAGRPRPGAGTPPGRSVLVLAATSQFMVILDAAIVNVALPSVGHDLTFTATGLAWVVNGYLLTFAGLLLLGGRATDRLGHRRTLAAGLSVFTAASLVAGLAPVPSVLVTARLVQGAGAALLAPASLAVVTTLFTEPRARARAFGTWSAAGGVGGMAGALAGGALTTGLSWRWVFLVNVPVGLALLVLVATSLTAAGPAPRQGRRHLDVAGAVTATAGLAAVVYAVTRTAGNGWTSAYVVTPAAAGLLLLAAFVVIEARVAAAPVLPLRLLGIRTIAVGNGMLLLFGGIAVSMWYFTSLFLQNVLGYGALGAGLGQTPAAVVFVVVARAAAALLPRAGVRPLVLPGATALAAGFGWLSHAGAGSGYPAAVLGPTVLVAIGIGLVFPSVMAAATGGAPGDDAGTVGGLANTATQVGGSIALAALTTAAATTSAATVAATTGSGHPIVALAAGYDLVFRVAAGLAVAVAALSLLLPRHRREPSGPSS